MLKPMKPNTGKKEGMENPTKSNFCNEIILFFRLLLADTNTTGTVAQLKEHPLCIWEAVDSLHS